ncbi:NADP-dependent oxidoreductase [Chryseobacterium sp. c4a]|uniref:NADP-dependent oxidoreductase n=1 Tax=Chryseobacterium sp. c4a TaxID=1573582 RepID=UPI001358263F|nr:NADP-dependent oxidoreductase [Chryseobacterium sp. c4a]
MKALQLISYGDLTDSLAFNEVVKPEILPHDVLIEVYAASVNPIDKLFIAGNLKDSQPLDLPATIGFDVSGVVVDKGGEVTEFEIGDEVYSRVAQRRFGTIAEYIAVDSGIVAVKPTNITFEEAASLPLVALTSIQSLERVGMKEGDRVLIHAGSGGVGSFAIQFAKTRGAYVYTTTSTENMDWVKELGADRVIDYKTEDYRTIATDLDIVFDTLGRNYTEEAFEVIKKGGRVVSIVGPLDEETARHLGIPNYKLPANLSQAIENKDATYKMVIMKPDGRQLAWLKIAVEDRMIKPVVDTVYPFSESIEAFEHLASGRSKGKIIIKVK